MVRTSILSMAFLVLAGTMTQAEEPKKAELKDGFRVYMVACRSQVRQLEGVYASAQEAIDAATKLRGRATVEVTTGTEGKMAPTGRPVFYHVYSKVCDKSGWRSAGIFADEKKLEAEIKAHQAKNYKTEIVHDYAPKEVFYVYGGGCSRSYQLRATCVTREEAFREVKELRKTYSNRCDVVTGTNGAQWASRSPKQFGVYVQGCKGSWGLETTTNDPEKVKKIVEDKAKAEVRTEVVHLYEPLAK